MASQQTRLVAAIAAIAAAAASCTHYQRYQAAPLDRGRAPARYAAHGLGAPALARFLADHSVPLGDSAWTTRQLALASLYYRPDLSEARADWRAAQAAAIKAGARPEPQLDASAEKASRPDEGRSSAWTFSLTAGLTLELGGKRSARLARARATEIGARLRLASAAWMIAQDTRLDALAAADAEQRAIDRDAELSQLDTVAALLSARFTAGEVTQSDVARADADAAAAAVARSQAYIARAAARAALARDLAMPVDSAQVRVAPDARSACAMLDSVSIDSLRVLALVTNERVGVGLADYAVSEADLRLAVAAQYPDVTIGPGILWDEGIGRWILSLGTPGIPLATRGPIAEATARRAAAASAVDAVEDSVLAQVDAAVATCRAVGHERSAADSLLASATRALDIASGAFHRGEVGQTDVAFARLALVRAESAVHENAGRDAAAGASLEAAVGRWLGARQIPWPDVTVPPDTAGAAP